MVGDSALSYENREGEIKRVERGISKLDYIPDLNIGLAYWGNACASVGVGGISIPEAVLRLFRIRNFQRTTMYEIGQAIADELNPLLEIQATARGGWSQVRCGIHLAGFWGTQPQLFHVHCGHDTEEPHELKVYMDFPYMRGDYLRQSEPDSLYSFIDSERVPFDAGCFDTTSGGSSSMGTSSGSLPGMKPRAQMSNDELAYESLHDLGFFHLRNGLISDFVDLWDELYGETPEDLVNRGVVCTETELSLRMVFYRGLLLSVCREWQSRSGELAPIGTPIYSLSFSHLGNPDLTLWKRTPLRCCDSGALMRF